MEKGKLSTDIYGFINSLLEAHPNVSLVLTGSRTLEERTEWADVLGKATYRTLNVLAPADAEALIRRPVENRLSIGNRSVQELLRLSNGHPFYTQFLCQTLVDVANEQRCGVADTRLLALALKRALENPPPQLSYQWTSLDSRQKLVLAALATVLKKSSDFASWERVVEVVESLPHRRRHGLDAVAVRVELESLRATGVLDCDKTRYRLSMDIMRLWVAAEHDLWKVLSEISAELPSSASPPA